MVPFLASPRKGPHIQMAHYSSIWLCILHKILFQCLTTSISNTGVTIFHTASQQSRLSGCGFGPVADVDQLCVFQTFPCINISVLSLFVTVSVCDCQVNLQCGVIYWLTSCHSICSDCNFVNHCAGKVAAH